MNSCIISFNLNCIMQLMQFYNIATKVSSRKKCYYFLWSTWLVIFNEDELVSSKVRPVDLKIFTMIQLTPWIPFICSSQFLSDILYCYDFFSQVSGFFLKMNTAAKWVSIFPCNIHYLCWPAYVIMMVANVPAPNCHLGPLLLTRFNFNPSMDK